MCTILAKEIDITKNSTAKHNLRCGVNVHDIHGGKIFKYLYFILEKNGTESLRLHLVILFSLQDANLAWSMLRGIKHKDI